MGSNSLRWNGWPTGGVRLASASTITASGTTHTKGDWSDLITAANVTQDCVGFAFGATNIATSTVDSSMLLDIGFGNTGNAVDRIALSNFPMGGRITQTWSWIPLHIPSGTRVAARIQAAISADTTAPNIVLMFGSGHSSWIGYTFGEALAVNAATSQFTYGDLTDNAYEEVISSTARDYRALQVVPALFDGTSSTSTFNLDLGIGAASAEALIGQTQVSIGTTEGVNTRDTGIVVRHVPAGSRLALRKNTANDATGGVIGWVA